MHVHTHTITHTQMTIERDGGRERETRHQGSTRQLERSMRIQKVDDREVMKKESANA